MRTMGPFVPVDDEPRLLAVLGRRGPRAAAASPATCATRRARSCSSGWSATADVLCENFRPGTMERWGLGPDDLPDELVYVRISVFGQNGPVRATARAGPARHRLRRPAPPDRRPGPPAGAPRGHRVGLPHRRLRRLRRGGRPLRPRHQPARGRRRSSTPRSTARSCASSSGRWPATTASASCASARATGSSHSAPLDNYPTGGRLLRLHRGRVGRQLPPAVRGDGPRPTWPTTPRFATLAERAARGDEINGIVADVDVAS